MLNPIKKKLNILAKILPFTKFLGHEVTIIAHRGNSSEAPENTLAAFKSAAKDNIPYIECDIHLTKDAVPVVFHDRCVSRTTNHHIPMPIDHLTLSEVKSLDCGFWFHSSFAGEKIPTLKEVLEAPLGNIGLMVEIKEGSAPDSILVAATLRVIHQYMNKGNSRPIIIGSKSPNIVKLVKDNTSQLKTIGIAEESKELFEHLDNNPDLLAPFKGIVTKDVVKFLHDKGKKVWVWTVDTPEELEMVKSYRVDGVISNRPKVMHLLQNNL